MNADTATPASPAPTTPQPPVPVPAPGATTPPAGDLGHHGHVHHEKNALLDWTKKAWEGVKHGKVGNPKLLLLLVAVVAIIGVWWFLAKASRDNDSALWSGFDAAGRAIGKGNMDEQLKQLEGYAADQSVKDSVASPILRLNALRLRKTTALRKLTGDKLADRQSAADELEKVREELVKAADWFAKDRTMKAATYLDAAEVELGLIGVPKADAKPLDADDLRSRGKVDKYAELMRKAADAIGPNTDAGKGFVAKADKYQNKDEAEKLYRRLGDFHISFNNPDPVGRPTDPSDPSGGFDPIPGGGPRRPTTLPDGPSDKPLAPGEGPKPPINPLDPPK